MLGPSAAEAAGLKYSLGSFGLVPRYVVAIPLFAAGAAMLLYWPSLAVVGAFVILAGHALLWVKSQTNAPGGATPDPDVWAPGEESWADDLAALEERAAKWDTTPWEISNGVGALSFITLVGISVFAAVALSDGGYGTRAVVAVGVTLVPIWFNGMRSTWNRSELRIKGDALRIAVAAAKSIGGDRYEVVPLLALRQTDRGRYPVDARIMLRPAGRVDDDFIGIQVQVAINSVQGTDYPYLYCVVLVKDAAPAPSVGKKVPGLVYENGKSEGVRFVVVRQHADNSGGWHTEGGQIQTIVGAALKVAGDL